MCVWVGGGGGGGGGGEGDVMCLRAFRERGKKKEETQLIEGLFGREGEQLCEGWLLQDASLNISMKMLYNRQPY